MQTDRHEDRVSKAGRPKGSVKYKDSEGNPIGVIEWRKMTGIANRLSITPNTRQYLLKLKDKYNLRSLDDTVRKIIKEWIDLKKEKMKDANT